MSSRLDRLILLLETGSTPSVRLTAARQLAQIATTRVAHQSQSSNNLSENWRGIEGEWGEVISLVTKIVVQLESRNYETRIATAAALALISKGVGIWDPTQSESIGSTSQLESPIDSTITGLFSLPEFNLNRLLTEGNLLLSSAGTEFLKTGNLSSVELAKAQKDTLGSLGLDDIGAEAIGIDLEAELAGNDAIKVEKQEGGNKLPPPKFKLEPGQPEFHLSSAINSNSTPTSGHSSSKPQPLKIKISKNTPISAPAIDSPSITPIDDDEDAYAGLSAREKNKLKRKRKSEAKAGGSSAISRSSTKVRIIEAPIISAPPISTPIIKEETKQETTGTGVVEGEAFIIDPGAKAKLRAQEQLNQGGEIAIDLEASKLSLVIEGEWPWKSIVAKLSTGLGSSKWEERHGAALGLKEILRLQGSGGGKIVGVSKEQNDRAHESWAEDLAVRLLCVFALDRFGDYISDQVIAPVRETAAQALATLLPQLSPSSIIEVKRVLVDMIEQNSSSPTKSIGYQSSSISKGKGKEVVDGKHIWQVRHAGLLGLKYLVAVRSDLLRSDAANEGLVMIKEENGDIKMKTSSELDLLKDVVDAALLGLRDSDDDVRSAAAATLTPIVDVLVEKLPVELEILIAVLWECLGDLKDDLSSSIGGIMDLLSRLLAFPSVLNLMKSPASLIPLLFPFFRHTISTVRLAVLKTILVFLQLPSLDYNFIDYKLFSLLFQNFILEEKLEIVKATQETWIACLQLNVLNLTPTILSNWFAILYSKIGSPVNINLFWSSKISLSGQGGFAYNVDKSLLAGDLALVSSERIMKGKITACIALGELISFWPLATHDSTFGGFLSQGLESNSTLQRFLSSTVIEEWCSAVHKDSYTPAITAISSLASRLSQKLHLLISFEPLANYDELDVVLSRIQGECVNLQVTFEKQGKITSGQIKVSVIPGTFTINQAQQVLDSFPDVINLIPKTTRKSLLPTLEEKKKKLKIAVGYYGSLKDGYDRQVFAGIAGAIVATRVIPAKVSPIIRSITNSIKMEEDPHLQARSAHSITSFIAICSSPTSTLRTNPSEKVVKNLCTFLCQDLTRTPIFSLAKNATGIASLKLKPARGLVADGKMERKDSEADGAAKLVFRGATLALAELAKNFGEEMLEKVPKLWSCMSESLLRTYLSQDIKIADELLESDDSKGQDLLDCLTVLPIAAAELTPALNHRLVALFPSLALAISSKFSVIRYAAAKCFTSLCDIAPMEGLKHVVEDVIPILGDPLNVDNRRGAIELISHLVELLDIKILPYVIFLIVPVLGRMSDSDDEVRLVATNTFATLIKLVPLEAGLPDPPGFSSEMLAKRISEREFLAQLLDGKQVEEYKIPIKIDIELRKYQREGVSWLAFLAKYQLHGLLCDDMGLGKTLQSICILASKHFERAERHRETGSLDSVHLPTLIVCPPTLTGHWQQEIKTYATDLKPLIYTGPSVDRKKLIKSFNKYDVIITSYEIIRNDIESLHKIDFNYYILDEGHIIKNGKTKLTKAIKQIKSIHRLILSGTPIQNNVLELWSLFDFLMPGFLGSEKNFNDRFGKPIAASRDAKSSSKEQESGALALEALHKQVLPFLLRRLKEDVLDDLPPKIIQDYYCELSPLQKKLYDDFSNSGAKQSVNGELSGKGDGKGQHVFQALQYLRKLVNHPVLILKPDLPNHQAVISQLESEGSSLRDISHAPKLEALRQILLDCGIGTSSTSDFDSVSLESVSQHRVLIFCQLKQMLDLIENDLFKPLMPTVTYMRMDGTTDPSKRHGVVQTFNSDPSIDCLLLTTHVGGLGLNLTGADTVIFIEHDWNPMKDLQAMDRAHRLGQKKVVNVYRLIMRGTLEEKIMGLQRFKLNIASSVVTQQNSDLSSLGTDQILDLFNVSSTPLPPSKPSNKPIGQKAILEGLGDLPPEEEYGELDLNAFTDSLA